MAYPHVPYTFTDGLLNDVTAARLNLIGTGIRDAQQAPAVRVFHNAAQAILVTTETTLAFNSERYDQAFGSASTQHDTVTNNSRLTALYAGIYLITATAEWSGSAADQYAAIRLNGATTIARQREPGGAGNPVHNITTMYSLAVNDYVELRVFTSTALSINSAANYSPEFSMVRVA